MLGKIILSLITLSSIYIGNELSSIYVLEEFENPFLYKMIYLSNKIIGNFAYFADYFGIESEYYVVRRAIEVIGKKTVFFDDEYTVYDTVFNRVPVRVYSPIKVKSSTPFMVYTHGGGYSLGHIDGFDTFLFEIAKRTNIIIMSVNYRLAPEFAYPIPIEDCYAVLEYAIENSNVLRLDTRRLIIGGDSSGGNLALVLSQRLYERRRMKARFQVLIYPWLQMFHLRLPSYLRYKSIHPTLSSAKMILWYLGFQQITTEMETFLLENKHTFLIKDLKLRQKIQSSLDINLIPKKYRQTRSYYNDYNNYWFSNITDISKEPLLRDKRFVQKVSKLVDVDLSPGLADIDLLRNLPETYMLAFEWDGLKDQQLIFAERLRLAGVPVNLVFNEEGFHGIATMLDPIFGLKLPYVLLDNLVDYILLNID